MAGHSAFKNIMHRKDAQDAKRARRFNQLAREISVAARGGVATPSANPRLRTAIETARAHNMPRERIERAIKGTNDLAGDTYQEVLYEAFAPFGVALMIETLTDNRRRTVAELRYLLSKYGGSLEASGSVRFHFERTGLIEYPADNIDPEQMLDQALQAGAYDLSWQEPNWHVFTAPEELTAVQTNLVKLHGSHLVARMAWRALNTINLEPEATQQLLELIRSLDDHPDVQSVDDNFVRHPQMFLS